MKTQKTKGATKSASKTEELKKKSLKDVKGGSSITADSARLSGLMGELDQAIQPGSGMNGGMNGGSGTTSTGGNTMMDGGTMTPGMTR